VPDPPEWGRPVRRVSARPGLAPALDSWPMTIPAVRQLLADGLELGPLTVLVGENGAGKSTLVEAIAMAFGLSPEGGSVLADHRTRPSESSLSAALTLTRGVGAARWGFFLRAETMHGFYTYLEDHPGRSFDPRYHEMSHGESFLEMLARRFNDPGFYVLDEPESALSFSGALALVAVLAEIQRSSTTQALVATHSPVIAATPGAVLYEVGDWGLRRSSWAELAVVRDWRGFLDAPDRYLRHLPGVQEQQQ